jgi:PHD/YefM family antitoxin component YafN of YafNO toxin-antitoxin module
MRTINATQLKSKTSIFLEETANNGEQINVWTNNGCLVILPEEEYRGLMETLQIDSNSYLRETVLTGLNTPISECIPEEEVEF